MSDKELLELAAKAAGMDDLEFGTFGLYRVIGVHDDGKNCMVEWNPLTNDGDVLRLAVKLTMSVEISEYEESTYAYAGGVPRVYAMELWRDDKEVATRRAIVRAAADIGKML